MRPDDHADLQELLGAYALDAVTPDEASRVEDHLRGCPRCRAEVDAHRETAAMLAGSGRSAPPEIWERISAALEDQPPRLEVARLGQGRARATRWLTVTAAAAAAAALVFMGLRLTELGRRVDTLVAVSERQGLAEAAAAAALDPDSARVDLRSPDGAVLATAVLRPDGTGYLMPRGLRGLPSGRTYQLWAIRDGQPVSAGVIGPDPFRIVAFSVPPDAAALAISEEEAGGAPSPNLPAVVEAEVVRA
jgi:Anti-sigma-K factor rskA/Putative zinc-finger